MRDRIRLTIGRSIIISATLALAAAPPVLGAGGASATSATGPRDQVRGDVSGYRLPFEAGLEVKIVQGWNSPYSHHGRSAYAYDFGLQIGTPVVAAASGVVSYTHSGETACGGASLRLNANLITINHPDGSATQYGHLSRVDVEVGDVVWAGQVIGLSGNTGYTGCTPHLHFARQVQGGPVTRSLPVYFQGYEDRIFASGQLIQAQPDCLAELAAVAATQSATERFCGTYYAGDFDGPPLFSRPTTELHVDRKRAGPGGYWLDEAQPYTVYLAGRFSLAPWWYTFHIEASGGIRVKLDGVVLYEDWTDDPGVRQVDLTRRLLGGVGFIEVEHLQTRIHDVLDVSWSPLLIDG